MKNPKSFRISCFIATLAIALGASACGRLDNSPNVRKASSETFSLTSQFGAAVSSGNDSNGDFDCADRPNIVPHYDYDRNGTGHFIACPNKKTTADVALYGKLSRSDTVCVFPIQVVDQSHVYTKPDLQSGAPMYQCGQLGSTGAIFTFQSINYNALFAVERPDLEQMQLCLLAGNDSLCPQRYSLGRFR